MHVYQTSALYAHFVRARCGNGSRGNAWQGKKRHSNLNFPCPSRPHCSHLPPAASYLRTSLPLCAGGAW
eukprot:743634-Pelagomonas_calceolata.AAC.3